MRRWIAVLAWCYRQMLRLYPTSYREGFAEEMEDVFWRRLEERGLDNPLRAVVLLLREGRDLPMNLVRAYRHQQVTRRFAQCAAEGVYPGITGGITMQRAFGIARATTVDFLLAVVAICIIVIAYQSLVLVCRPNCVGADLRGAMLYRPYLVDDPEWGLHIQLRDVDFRNARLDEVDLRGGWLRRVDLRGATLTQAKLRHADFAWAQMNGADLREADLFRANLYDVDLQLATLMNADLRQAYMIKADLRGAELTNVNLIGAQYSQLTQWPEGFDPQAAGAIFHYICEPRPFCK